jgi:hypothetical protein
MMKTMVKRFSPVLFFLTTLLFIPVSCVEENLTKPKDDASAGDFSSKSTSEIGILSNHPRVLVPNLDFMLPGARFVNPEFSWKYEVAPGGISFVKGGSLGPQFEGNLIMGAARAALEGGHLFRFRLTGNRRSIAVDDERLEDRLADNFDKFDITESESLLFGTDFGVAPDVQSGPDGNVYVVSISHGAVYEIFRSK